MLQNDRKKTEIELKLGTRVIFSKKYRFLRQSIFDKKSKAIYSLRKIVEIFRKFFFFKTGLYSSA